MRESSVKREEDALRTIGRYEVLGILGRGSMGVVYKARDPEIGREVAIKTLRKIPSTQFNDADAALARFRSEARSAGNLRHPNIITVFEVNRDNDTPYLVMDYVRGESLDVLIARQGRIEPPLVMYYLWQLAAALDYAHSKGVIHRDIKPSNILVDENSNVFILDFGVATINSTFLNSAKSPEELVVVGTPGYMSPEQILNHPLDRRSDLFSLAVVTFECLTGKRPFPGENFTTVIGNILNAKPLALTMLTPELPLALEAEFERALARKAAERFAAAHLMAEHFCRALGIAAMAFNPGATAKQASQRRRKSTGWKSFRPAVGSTNKTSNTTASDAGEGNQAEEHLSPWTIGLRKIELEDRPPHWVPNQRPGAAVIFGGAELAGNGPLLLAGRPLLRMFTLLFAGMCLALAAALLWLVIDPKAEVDKYAGKTALRPAAPAAIWVDAAENTPLLLPLTDPVPPDKSVHEMSDRQVLGVIVGSDITEELLLKALKEGLRRSLAGLVEASTVPLQSDSYVVRIETMKVLAVIGDRRIVPYIIPRLNDHDPLVRGHAARALALLADRRALGYLTARYLREEVPEVKKALKQAIEKINGFPMK